MCATEKTGSAGTPDPSRIQFNNLGGVDSGASSAQSADPDFQKALDYVTATHPDATPDEQTKMANDLVDFSKRNKMTMDESIESVDVLFRIFTTDEDFDTLLTTRFDPLAAIYLGEFNGLTQDLDNNNPGIANILGELSGVPASFLSFDLETAIKLVKAGALSDNIRIKVDLLNSLERKLEDDFPNASQQFYDRITQIFIESVVIDFRPETDNVFQDLFTFYTKEFLESGVPDAVKNPVLSILVNDLGNLENNSAVNQFYASMIVELKSVQFQDQSQVIVRLQALAQRANQNPATASLGKALNALADQNLTSYASVIEILANAQNKNGQISGSQLMISALDYTDTIFGKFGTDQRILGLETADDFVVRLGGFVDLTKAQFPELSDAVIEQMFLMTTDINLPFIKTPQDALINVEFKEVTGKDITEEQLAEIKVFAASLSGQAGSFKSADVTMFSQMTRALSGLDGIPYAVSVGGKLQIIDPINILKDALLDPLIGGIKPPGDGNPNYILPNNNEITPAQFKNLLDDFRVAYTTNLRNGKAIDASLNDALVAAFNNNRQFDQQFVSEIVPVLNNTLVKPLKSVDDARKALEKLPKDGNGNNALANLILQQGSLPEVNSAVIPDNKFPLRDQIDTDVLGFVTALTEASINKNGNIDTTKGLQKLSMVIDILKAQNPDEDIDFFFIASSTTILFSDEIIKLVEQFKDSKNIFIIVFLVLVKYSSQVGDLADGSDRLSKSTAELQVKTDQFKADNERLQDLQRRFGRASDKDKPGIRSQIDELQSKINVESNDINRLTTQVQNDFAEKNKADQLCTDILAELKKSGIAVNQGIS